jgi:excisionase family DNA binding protein
VLFLLPIHSGKEDAIEVMRVKREINIADLQHKRYLTNREAQVYLNKSHTTMWRLMQAGEIAYSRTGMSLLFDRNDLDDYVQRNRIAAIAE